NPPNYLPKEDQSVAAIAAREGRTAPEVAYDTLIEDGGRNFLYTPIVNYYNYDLSAPETMLADPNAIMGLGDGGAHVRFILHAGFPTWLLTYWGRERQRFPLEELVRRLTSDTAGGGGRRRRRVPGPGGRSGPPPNGHQPPPRTPPPPRRRRPPPPPRRAPAAARSPARHGPLR